MVRGSLTRRPTTRPAAAVAQWGAPDRLYCDNGLVDTSDRLVTVLARLGTRLAHTPPDTPSGQGKQERCWGSLPASFLPELWVSSRRRR